MIPENFGIKKEESSTTATTQNAIGDINEDSSMNRVSHSAENVNGDIALSEDLAPVASNDIKYEKI